MITYMCAYLRYYYPKEFIAGYLNFAANADDVKNGQELAREYGVTITPPTYGVSRGGYTYDKEAGVIAKGLSSIKYLGDSVAEELYEISKTKSPKRFSELLIDLQETSIDNRQLNILVNIDFFRKFGTVPKLARILQAYQILYKQKKFVSSLQKSKIGNGHFAEIISKYATDKTRAGKESTSYKFESTDKVIECLYECEDYIQALNIPDLTMKQKVANSIEYLGYCDVQTGLPQDRRKLIIAEVYANKQKGTGEIWGYRVETRSLGTGKDARLTIPSRIYNKNPINKGDIIYATNVYKNSKGYWYMDNYQHIE